jgi:hypothetical protein
VGLSISLERLVDRRAHGMVCSAGSVPAAANAGQAARLNIGGPELATLFDTVFHERLSGRTLQFLGFGFLLATGLFGGSLLHFRATRVFGDLHFLSGLIHSAFFAGLGSGFSDVK